MLSCNPGDYGMASRSLAGLQGFVSASSKAIFNVSDSDSNQKTNIWDVLGPQDQSRSVHLEEI